LKGSGTGNPVTRGNLKKIFKLFSFFFTVVYFAVVGDGHGRVFAEQTTDIDGVNLP
jgi:hypothetical protein